MAAVSRPGPAPKVLMIYNKKTNAVEKGIELLKIKNLRRPTDDKRMVLCEGVCMYTVRLSYKSVSETPTGTMVNPTDVIVRIGCQRSRFERRMFPIKKLDRQIAFTTPSGPGNKYVLCIYSVFPTIDNHSKSAIDFHQHTYDRYFIVKRSCHFYTKSKRTVPECRNDFWNRILSTICGRRLISTNGAGAATGYFRHLSSYRQKNRTNANRSIQKHAITSKTSRNIFFSN